MYKKIICFLLTAIFLFSINIQSEVLIKYTGKVFYKKSGTDKYKKARINMRLRKGDIILTKENSRATLSVLNGEGFIYLEENSKLLISENVEKESKTRSFLLFLGRLKSKITKKQNNEVNFMTPTAVVGVRGTEFVIAVADEGTSKIGVINGEVGLTGNKQEIVLAKNEASVVPLGGEPRDKTAFSENEDLKKWQNQIKKEIKGNEISILNRVKNILENNYLKIDLIFQEKEENLNKIRKLKEEKKKLEEEGKTEEARQKGSEISEIVTKRTRLIIRAHNLDHRNQSIFEIAERIYKKNKANSDIVKLYKEIEEKYNIYHSKFIKTPQKKKGCLSL